MAYNQVIMNYAYSLFEVAKEKNILDDTYQKLDAALKLINSSPELNKALCAPIIEIEQKSRVINEICEKLEINETVKNFLYLLAKNKRFGLLEQITAALNYIIMHEKNIVEAKITTAKQLSDSEFQAIQQFITEKYKKNFTFSKTIDISLIGGLTVEFDNKILDASMKEALTKLKNKSKELISVL